MKKEYLHDLDLLTTMNELENDFEKPKKRKKRNGLSTQIQEKWEAFKQEGGLKELNLLDFPAAFQVIT